MRKHLVTWLAAMPLALSLVNFAEAGFRCGGCSDPCHPVRSHVAVRNACSTGSGSGSAHSSCGASGYSGYSVVEASPASCGAVAADGSYGLAYAAPLMSAPSVGYATTQAVIQQAPVAVAPQIVCEPVTGYRTVMESTFVTETQYVNAMETKQETRTRVKKVSKQVPVTVDDFRTTTVMVPTTETKTIEYTVLVPEQSTKTVDVTVTVPVWNEVSENYTVKVPTISDVSETYNVNVARLKDESFTYTVYVPQTETVTKMQTVTNAVPVVKTRTVQRTVPSYSTTTVTKDYGHWETVVEEVAGSSYGAVPAAACNTPVVQYANAQYSSGCGTSAVATTVVSGGGCGNGMFAPSTGCGCAKAKKHCGCGARKASCGCNSGVNSSCGTATCGSSAGSTCGGNAIVSGSVVYGSTIATGCGSTTAVAAAPATTTRRVWVPSVVTEEVPVVTNTVTNEEVAYTVYEQQSTQVPYDCTYVSYRPEQRTGTKKVVEYVPEPRTRTRKVVSYTDEQRTRTRRELTYTTQTKQETYPVVTYKTEKKTKDISFTINVPTQNVEAFQTTRYETVTEDVVEEYTVNVQVPTTKEVQVQVCKMVPKLVAYTFNPCANTTMTSSAGCGAASGCGTTTQTTASSAGCGCGVAPVTTASPCGCAK